MAQEYDLILLVGSALSTRLRDQLALDIAQRRTGQWAQKKAVQLTFFDFKRCGEGEGQERNEEGEGVLELHFEIDLSMFDF